MAALVRIDHHRESAAEGMLQLNESLAEFVEAALQESFARRCMQALRRTPYAARLNRPNF